jgi:hypothetical protein
MDSTMKRNYASAAILAAVFCISGNLWAATYSGGGGTQADPYKISTAADWQTLMSTSGDWNKQFILTANLDLTGVGLIPVGYNHLAFSGVMDGQGYCIRKAVITQSGDYIGLFGIVSGQVMNLGLEECSVSGRQCVGGLVGLVDHNGLIQFCFATGTVTAANGEAGGLAGAISASYARGETTSSGSGGQIGGLVGCNYSTGSITACYAAATVTCTGTGTYLGGLVGLNEGAIASCFAQGSVSGANYIGGLVGTSISTGTILKSYAACAVSGSGSGLGGLTAFGSSVASFWDVDLCGYEGSSGRGLRTSEMQTELPFLENGWDFLRETDNGTDDIWMIPTGGGYPILTWITRSAHDLLAQAVLLPIDVICQGSSIAATGQDVTLNGYNDFADVWYYYDCTANDKFTITLNSPDFDTTLAVFDAKGHEIIFNDDFFGGKSVVILKARLGVRYYIRTAGYDGQRGEFEISLARGAVQAIQGDLNYDGNVNLTDLAIFAGNWLEGI